MRLSDPTCCRRFRRAIRARAACFATTEARSKNYFEKTGIFPTSHIVTLKQEFVDRHPGAPVALLKAFRQIARHRL